MSLSTTSPTSPLEQRDFRSTSIKRSRDHTSKWHLGVRPPRNNPYYWGPGYDIPPNHQPNKVRPQKIYSFPKSHQTKNTPPSSHDGSEFSVAGVARIDRTIDAHHVTDEHASSPLSASLIALLPPDTRTSSPAIHTVPADVDILYSFDSRGASPGIRASEVHLDSLVEEAERKWVSEQTERIVRGEWEVLDGRGEKSKIGKARGKGRKSPKAKAVEHTPVEQVIEDEDGFELI